MISAKQAREKQASINWRDNKKAVSAYNKQKAEVLKEIENNINEAIVGDEECASYFWYTEYFDELDRVAEGAEFSLAIQEMKTEIRKELEELGYDVEHNCGFDVPWWNIEWGDSDE